MQQFQNIAAMVVGAVGALSFLLLLINGEREVYDQRFGAWGPTWAPMALGIFLFLVGLVGFVRRKK